MKRCHFTTEAVDGAAEYPSGITEVALKTVYPQQIEHKQLHPNIRGQNAQDFSFFFPRIENQREIQIMISSLRANLRLKALTCTASSADLFKNLISSTHILHFKARS